MSRLVLWGHWLVAAYFGLLGAASFWGAITKLPKLFHDDPNQVTYVFVTDASWWLPLLVCAWGIFKVRSWARILAFVVATLILTFEGVLISFDPQSVRGTFGLGILTVAVCAGLAIAWLFVLAVRDEYSQRSQLA